MKRLTTQVAIIGGGPAGMLLAHILARSGIESIVLESRPKAHVLGRIRAGVLEHATAQLLRDYDLGTRMDQIGRAKNGTQIVWQDQDSHFIDVRKWTGKQMVAYGQTFLTEDLYAAHHNRGEIVLDEVSDLAIHDVEQGPPSVTFTRNGQQHLVNCDFVAGCDGIRGTSRNVIPEARRKSFFRSYPFGWLGIMVERPPLEEFTYCYHSTGFAMAAQRTPTLSRYYVQAPATDNIDQWSDQRFWDVLLSRFPPSLADKIQTGPSIEKSIAPLRSVVHEPLSYGRLFLAGDAAHVVPPTGAKGLNLAIADVHYLGRALEDFYKRNSSQLISSYSATALKRIWAAERLSWWLTLCLHTFPDDDPFTIRMRETEYRMLLESEPAQMALASEYAGQDI